VVRVDYSQGFYFEPTTGGEVRIFGFYTNKHTNKGTNNQKQKNEDWNDESMVFGKEDCEPRNPADESSATQPLPEILAEIELRIMK